MWKKLSERKIRMRLNPFARGPKAYEDITPEAVEQWRGQENAPQLLDVRTAGEYQQEHLPGSRLIPLNELQGRLGQLEKDRPVVVYCARGHRSRTAARLLGDQGYVVHNLLGGIQKWKGPVEPR